MNLFNKKEIYLGYSLENFIEIREILALEGIKYTYKIINHSGELIGQGTIRGTIGSRDINAKFENLYSVSVKKADYENANYLIESKKKRQ